MPLHFDASARTTVMVHYFRAMVARADVWRTRMDATPNKLGTWMSPNPRISMW